MARQKRKTLFNKWSWKIYCAWWRLFFAIRIKGFGRLEFFRVCPFCGRLFSNIERRRLNTCYADEKMNYLTSCSECYKETTAHYRELWDMYHDECM